MSTIEDFIRAARDALEYHSGRVSVNAYQAQTIADALSKTMAGLQAKVRDWTRDQPWFGKQDPWELLLGIQEEVGELSRSYLKQHQGIRGTGGYWDAKGKDAVGDVLIFLAGYCEARGWSMQECVDTAANEVFQRNWTKFPQNGTTE